MDEEFMKRLTGESERTNILIVGDGDYSFSVAFFARYKQLFTASTLEVEEVMMQKYPNIANNIDYLKNSGVIVITGVDATKLEQHFPLKSFSHIIFNFPHVGGKSNIKKNRQLLEDFFQSASHCLLDKGKIMVTLCKGQGGTQADNPQREWCNSWQVTAKAANSGLILSSVHLFEGPKLFEEYLSTGFRSQNKRFNTDDSLVHTFIKSQRIPEPMNVENLCSNSQQCLLQVINDFAEIITSGWELTFEEHSSMSTSYSYEEANSSPELPIYNIKVRFILTHDHLCPLPNIKFVSLERTYLLHQDADNLVLSIGNQINKDRLVVGCKNKDSLTLDVTKILGCLLELQDLRYLVYGFKTVRFMPDLRGDKCLCFDVDVVESYCPSIYPPYYTFDISFWLSINYSIDGFLLLVRNMSNGLVKSVTLIDTYDHPGTGAQSHCYRILYQSLDSALSYSQAYQYYQYLWKICQKHLHVELR